jgi:hypothetical protein
LQFVEDFDIIIVQLKGGKVFQKVSMGNVGQFINKKLPPEDKALIGLLGTSA